MNETEGEIFHHNEEIPEHDYGQNVTERQPSGFSPLDISESSLEEFKTMYPQVANTLEHLQLNNEGISESGDQLSFNSGQDYPQKSSGRFKSLFSALANFFSLRWLRRS